MKNETEQRELFRQAVEALGGRAASAARLAVSERHVRKLIAGESALHDGILRDIARALLAHADECKRLEKALSPAFAANLTAEQLERQGKPDGRRFDAREQADG
jgi:DNA-binding transcriptional regulator YdaS (Cro superfamily)